VNIKLELKSHGRTERVFGHGKADCYYGTCYISGTINKPSSSIEAIEISDWLYFEQNGEIRRIAYVDVNQPHNGRIITFGIREAATL
jgi:hypothetical protein